jgi:type III pantothenate kinase
MVSEHASPLAVLGGADAGGQNVHVAALSEAMARRGARVVVHTRRDDPGLPRRVDFAPGVQVDHVTAGPPTRLSKDELFPHMDVFAAQLVEQWREWRPDVVHAHFWMSGHASLIAAAELGIPVVQTFHALGAVKRRYQGDRDTSPPERCGIERGILRGASHVIATCTDEVFELLRMDASRTKLTVIPCGAELAQFAPDGRAAPPRTRGRRRLVCVGRLVQRKGVGTAISSLAYLGDDVELLIAGGPALEEMATDPEAIRLRELADREGVVERVRLLGRRGRADTAALLRSADVAVAVPWYEPFGIVPVEAMACGVPVVASAVGGMIDTVVDGITGIHVPPRDPERLADALRPLLCDAERRGVMGRAGVERARRLYDWNRIGAATLDVYARVADAGRGGRFRRGERALMPRGRDHFTALQEALNGFEGEVERVEAWGEKLAVALDGGARLLVVGTDAASAQAEELVAALLDRPRPMPAMALEVGGRATLARQVWAHGRTGDVLVVLADGPDMEDELLEGVAAARERGLATWALTGPAPAPLGGACEDHVAVRAASRAVVRELHLVAVHVVCVALERELALRASAAPARRRARRRGRHEVVAG